MADDGPGNKTRVCIDLPPKVLSSGLGKQFLDKTGKYHWLDYSLPRLELHVAMIFCLTMVSHFFLRRLGLPLFTSQIIVCTFSFSLLYILFHLFPF